MEKITGFLRTTYYYTDKQNELPEFLVKEFQKALSVDFTKEKFIAACWLQNIISKGKIFVVITDRRVAYKDIARVQQNAFKDLTGVERDLLKNIILLSPGNTTKLFPNQTMPAERLLTMLFTIINENWLKSVNKVDTKGDNDIISQIEKLNDLKQKGIISESEFEEKKSQFLSRL